MIPGMNDDDWMKPPVNYTPYFEWYIKQQDKKQRTIVEKINKALWRCERDSFIRDLYMDLYLVWWDKDTKTFRPRTRQEVLGE